MRVSGVVVAQISFDFVSRSTATVNRVISMRRADGQMVRGNKYVLLASDFLLCSINRHEKPLNLILHFATSTVITYTHTHAHTHRFVIIFVVFNRKPGVVCECMRCVCFFYRNIHCRRFISPFKIESFYT